MEREQHETDDAEHEANLQEAFSSQSKAREGARRQMVRRQGLLLREGPDRRNRLDPR